MWIKLVLGIALITIASGCATARKNQTSETQMLQSRVSELESQLQQKDEEISGLQERLSNNTASDYSAKNKSTLKSTPKRIQLALKNAGFYKGTVDGKVGKKTREAIKEFQKANSLKADGIVGQQTWMKLSEYLGNE